MLVTVVLALVLVGALFAFVYPTRTFVDQRAELRDARERLALLRAENDELDREITRLDQDAEVERIARESYGLLRPGERAFVIVPVPASTTTTTVPATGTPAR